jgi:hypothetical protein
MMVEYLHVQVSSIRNRDSLTIVGSIPPIIAHPYAPQQMQLPIRRHTQHALHV